MFDLETRLHDTIGVLAAAEPVTTPPLDLLLERPAPPPVHPSPPRRSRPLIAAAVAGSLALAATGAGAVGLLPGPVDRALHRISDWGAPCRLDLGSARKLAAADLPNGQRLEWSRATGAAGQEGDDVRVLDPAGASHDVAQSCLVDRPVIAQLGQRLVFGSGQLGSRRAFWGRAPKGAVSVRAVSVDGTASVFPLQRDRFYAGSVRASLAPDGDTVRIEALDATGAVLEASS